MGLHVKPRGGSYQNPPEERCVNTVIGAGHGEAFHVWLFTGKSYDPLLGMKLI